MTRYISKDELVAKTKKLIRENELYLYEKASDVVRFQKTGAYSVLNDLLHFIDTLEVKEVDLSDRKPDWHPNKKQIESLGALVRYNIGVFDYQKLNEVALLYEDLTKILDYETDRQK